MQILSSDILDINRGEYHAIYQLWSGLYIYSSWEW